MKHTLLASLLMLSVNFSEAQSSGVVYYERRIQLDIDDQSGIPENIRALMPKDQTEKKLLRYNGTASLYSNDEVAQDAPQEMKGDGITIRVQTVSDEEYVYLQESARKFVEQKSFMGRNFLITHEWSVPKWKITGKEKTLLGHPVTEAISVVDSDTVTAWYATDIPVSVGPESLYGLPGLILEARIGSRVTVTATAIGPGDAKMEKSIKEPSKGKKVNSKEFAAIQKEKTEEMKRESDGGGNQIIFQTITR